MNGSIFLKAIFLFVISGSVSTASAQIYFPNVPQAPVMPSIQPQYNQQSVEVNSNEGASSLCYPARAGNCFLALFIDGRLIENKCHTPDSAIKRLKDLEKKGICKIYPGNCSVGPSGACLNVVLLNGRALHGKCESLEQAYSQLAKYKKAGICR